MPLWAIILGIAGAVSVPAALIIVARRNARDLWAEHSRWQDQRDPFLLAHGEHVDIPQDSAWQPDAATAVSSGVKADGGVSRAGRAGLVASCHDRGLTK